MKPCGKVTVSGWSRGGLDEEHDTMRAAAKSVVRTFTRRTVPRSRHGRHADPGLRVTELAHAEVPTALRVARARLRGARARRAARVVGDAVRGTVGVGRARLGDAVAGRARLVCRAVARALA